MLPKIGLNIFPLPASLILSGGVRAEQCGYESVWLGDHVAIPASVISGSPGGTMPFDSDSSFLDPLLVLSHIAAVTTTLRIGLGVYVLPLRDPVLVARSYVTLDHLSGGRLEFGVGVGWLRTEFDIMGRDFRTRGRRTDEMLAIMDVLFTEEHPSYESPQFQIPPIGFAPKPLPGPGTSKLIGGGYSGAAYERASRCDGWIGRIERLDPATNGTGRWNVEAVAVFSEKLRAAVEAAGRNPESYEITGEINGAPSEEQLGELKAAGVDRVVINPWDQVGGKYVGLAQSLEPVIVYAESIGLGSSA
jgi:probable F420-dependent oxidoreductase